MGGISLSWAERVGKETKASDPFRDDSHERCAVAGFSERSGLASCAWEGSHNTSKLFRGGKKGESQVTPVYLLPS